MPDNPIKYSYDHALMPSKRFKLNEDTGPEGSFMRTNKSSVTKRSNRDRKMAHAKSRRRVKDLSETVIFILVDSLRTPTVERTSRPIYLHLIMRTIKCP